MSLVEDKQLFKNFIKSSPLSNEEINDIVENRFIKTASTNIREIAYQHETQELRTRFNNNTVYLYEKVSPREFKEFVSSKSLGSYFHDRIRFKKKFKKVD